VVGFKLGMADPAPLSFAINTRNVIASPELVDYSTTTDAWFTRAHLLLLRLNIAFTLLFFFFCSLRTFYPHASSRSNRSRIVLNNCHMSRALNKSPLSVRLDYCKQDLDTIGNWALHGGKRERGTAGIWCRWGHRGGLQCRFRRSWSCSWGIACQVLRPRRPSPAAAVPNRLHSTICSHSSPARSLVDFLPCK